MTAAVSAREATAKAGPLIVTPAAQAEIGEALSRQPPPAAVRVRATPGLPQSVQMYVTRPRLDEEVLQYGEARLVIDEETRDFLQGAIIDFHQAKVGSSSGQFSVRRADLPPSGPVGEPSDPEWEAGRGQVGPTGAIEEQLREALRQIFDPEIPVNIIDLGLIYAIEPVADSTVRIRMSMTAPGCPVAEMLRDQVKTAAERIPGVRVADVRVVWEPPWSPDRMSPSAKRQLGYL